MKYLDNLCDSRQNMKNNSMIEWLRKTLNQSLEYSFSYSKTKIINHKSKRVWRKEGFQQFIYSVTGTSSYPQQRCAKETYTSDPVWEGLRSLLRQMSAAVGHNSSIHRKEGGVLRRVKVKPGLQKYRHIPYPGNSFRWIFSEKEINANY